MQEQVVPEAVLFSAELYRTHPVGKQKSIMPGMLSLQEKGSGLKHLENKCSGTEEGER
jgi:hypothetical protein